MKIEPQLGLTLKFFYIMVVYFVCGVFLIPFVHLVGKSVWNSDPWQGWLVVLYWFFMLYAFLIWAAPAVCQLALTYTAPLLAFMIILQQGYERRKVRNNAVEKLRLNGHFCW